MSAWRKAFALRWGDWSQRSFPRLLTLFIGRMFHGGSELGTEELDLGIAATGILLAMPGLLVSLLLLEKYGSLTRWLRGDRPFDPFVTTVPDEYFFIVLSMSVTGIATLWKWTTIFPDRRDFANLVHLPISLRSVFAANFAALAVLACVYTMVVNAASLLLFPGAVFGTDIDIPTLVRFSFGHAVAVIAASLLAFCAVFALMGILLALFPYGISRRISLLARFVVMVCLLALLASSLSVPNPLARGPSGGIQHLTMLPPLWFLGLSQWLWGRGSDPFFAGMARRALLAFLAVPLVAVVAYVAGFRRAFQKIPEVADLPVLPRSRQMRSAFRTPLWSRLVFRTPTQRACGSFIIHTFGRSEAHQQVLLFFIAIGVVVCAKRLADVPIAAASATRSPVLAEYLAVPFILTFCVIVGLRCCFEIPLDLQANWIFKLWMDAKTLDARATARKVLLLLSLSWIAPITLVWSTYLWGFYFAMVHTLMVIGYSMVIVEVSLVHFRKLPFTCEYPRFESHSPLIVVAYLFAFILLTSCVPKGEQWLSTSPWTAPVLFLPILAAIVGLHQYRKSMLPMDKELIFEQPESSWN
jgi:hypothetical protein